MFEDLSCLKKIIIFLDLKRNETLKRGLNDNMSFKDEYWDVYFKIKEKQLYE